MDIIVTNPNLAGLQLLFSNLKQKSFEAFDDTQANVFSISFNFESISEKALGQWISIVHTLALYNPSYATAVSCVNPTLYGRSDAASAPVSRDGALANKLIEIVQLAVDRLRRRTLWQSAGELDTFVSSMLNANRAFNLMITSITNTCASKCVLLYGVRRAILLLEND